ncbi:MAG: hypothetical protein IPK06_04480 [Ignavibacteriae bacterium]|nr:hypothetical protein [Ignavibacteriota bacterium]
MINKERQSNQEDANLKTEQAQKELKIIDNLLRHTLDVDDTIDWNKLKSKKKFSEINPNNSLDLLISKIKKPHKKELKEYPRKPQSTDKEYIPKITLFDKMISSRKKAKEDNSKNLFNQSLNNWEKRLE